MMLSTMLVCLSLTVQLAFCAWAPEREMELAMWRTRWSGVSHYGKLPIGYLSAKDPFEFLDKDTTLENWQQACIHRKDKEQRNSTRRGNPTTRERNNGVGVGGNAREGRPEMQGNGMRRNTTRRGNHYDNRTEGREWKGEEYEQNRKERPWVNPSCDAYSLAIGDACKFTRYSRPGKEYAFTGRKTDYVTIEGGAVCFFREPLTARTLQRSDLSDRFHPTLASPQRSINPQFMHMMYRCPSTRPLAIWACSKCGSTSLGNWVMRLEHPSLIERVSQIMDEIIASYPDTVTIGWAITNAVLHDFPGSITENDLVKIIARKTWVIYDSLIEGVPQRNGTNIVGDTTRLIVRMPRSYCPLCCAWGDGRLKIIVARNPYVRLMSYYKMRMRDERQSGALSMTLWYEGWSDFRPWLLAFLSHRERTGRFTSDSVDQFTDDELKDCTQKDPTCVNDSALDEPCAMECADRRPIIKFRDVTHAMPVVDSLLAAGYETHVREELFQLLHLESIKKDIHDIEERLCREYDDCEPLPEYPRVLPRLDNNDICHFNAKTRAFSNCTVTWEELWPPSLVDLVNLHYAEDFRLLGYKTTPFDVMPIRKDI